jgi:hypothetical protein
LPKAEVAAAVLVADAAAAVVHHQVPVARQVELVSIVDWAMLRVVQADIQTMA